MSDQVTRRARSASAPVGRVSPVHNIKNRYKEAPPAIARRTLSYPQPTKDKTANTTAFAPPVQTGIRPTAISLDPAHTGFPPANPAYAPRMSSPHPVQGQAGNTGPSGSNQYYYQPYDLVQDPAESWMPSLPYTVHNYRPSTYHPGGQPWVSCATAYYMPANTTGVEEPVLYQTVTSPYTPNGYTDAALHYPIVTSSGWTGNTGELLATPSPRGYMYMDANRAHHTTTNLPSWTEATQHRFTLPAHDPSGNPSAWTIPQPIGPTATAHPNTNLYIDGVRVPTGPRNARRPFQPMEAVAKGPTKRDRLSAEAKLALGFSPNYKGDVTNPKNRSADIPVEQSTCLWITNLPPGVTVKAILDALSAAGPFGKVWFTSVVEGGPSHKHPTAAAKLTMFTRLGAEAIYNFIDAGGLFIQEYQAHVTWNRQHVAEQDGVDPTPRSRVLLIRGPAEIVNEASIREYLDDRVWFREQEFECVTAGDTGYVIFTFGSFYNQAASARMALNTKWPAEKVWIRYGTDPMEVGVEEARRANAGAIRLPVVD